jgi:large subunit ribosomal protein L35Ae
MSSGIIVNYKRGRKTQTTNQMIVILPEITSKEKALMFVGKKVVYVCEGKDKKKINGEIRAPHGCKGAVRVLFERGMPGQAIGGVVEVLD